MALSYLEWGMKSSLERWYLGDINGEGESYQYSG